jgi:RNA polymerase sigma-70 factor (ECF subfamily)
VVPSSAPDQTKQLMAEFRRGNPEAAGQLVDFFYPELRRLASSRMLGERTNHTWQPTVLVHEMYLELTRIKALPADPAVNQDERNAFFALAAFLMRRLLTHYARPLPKRITKAEISEALEQEASPEESLAEIEALLSRLEAIDPKLRTVVEMKVFEGLSREEIAERLGCSVRTVARHWDFAQQWLRNRSRNFHTSPSILFLQQCTQPVEPPFPLRPPVNDPFLQHH